MIGVEDNDANGSSVADADTFILWLRWDKSSLRCTVQTLVGTDGLDFDLGLLKAEEIKKEIVNRRDEIYLTSKTGAQSYFGEYVCILFFFFSGAVVFLIRRE